MLKEFTEKNGYGEIRNRYPVKETLCTVFLIRNNYNLDKE